MNYLSIVIVVVFNSCFVVILAFDFVVYDYVFIHKVTFAFCIFN